MAGDWPARRPNMFRDILVHVDGRQAGRRRVQLAVDLAALRGSASKWASCDAAGGSAITVQAEPRSPRWPPTSLPNSPSTNARPRLVRRDQFSCCPKFPCWCRTSGSEAHAVGHERDRAEHEAAHDFGNHHGRAQPDDPPSPALICLVIGAQKDVGMTVYLGAGFSSLFTR